ncbi:MAG: heavy metal translocating P-type ATPase [Oscillospiraceae bacterium]|nr:heavy metal translocating P-type ATPase [Oscillospiraceae bacterium]
MGKHLALNRQDCIACPSCSDCRADSHDAAKQKHMVRYITFAGGLAAYIAALVIEPTNILKTVLFFAAYLAFGSSVLYAAFRSIIKIKIFDENFLMAIATIGAFAIGEYAEGVAVMIFYQIGELFQDFAVGRSRKSIEDLMDIRPDYANLKTSDGLHRTSPQNVSVGDIIAVKAGEKIPLDGLVLEGFASIDASALTGESMPRDVAPGSEILAGSVNLNGLLTIRVTKPFGESTVSKILDLVQNASSKKTKTEKFITKFARIYTPVVVLAALALSLIPPLVIPGQNFAEWINRSLVFLVVSCPCALVISIPLGYFGGIGSASRSGILIKGSDFLDALTNIKTVVFDKTGSLTHGKFIVTQVVPEPGNDKNRLLHLAAHAESLSNHPIALSILKAYDAQIDHSLISNHEEIAGLGIKAVIAGQQVLAGNRTLMASHNIDVPKIQTAGTTVFVAENGTFAGYIEIEDQLKPDSRQAIRELKKSGVKSIAMLTGDNFAAARKTAEKIGINEFYAELLPQGKVEKLENMLKNCENAGTLAFVGDGINDAPVLARADIGVAMGGVGSDAAIEAADVVLMTDEPHKLATAIRIAKKTRRIVWQNIVFSLFVKAVILILGALGLTTMWAAVFGDVGVAMLAVFNSMRALKN